MKYIEKKTIAVIPKATGCVSDTLNVEDKTTNAPSIRLMEEQMPDTGTTLYESSAFASTGTLSDSIINYRRIKVYARNSDWHQISEEFLVGATATSTTAYTVTFWSGSCGDEFYGKSGRLTITDKKFTLDRLKGINLSNSGVSVSDNANAYVILKIVGYKE